MFGGILGYIFGGLVIGILARLIKPGADPIGWILTIILGIAGAAPALSVGEAVHLRPARYRVFAHAE